MNHLSPHDSAWAGVFSAGLAIGHLEAFLNNLSWLIKASATHSALFLSGEGKCGCSANTGAATMSVF